MKTNNQLDKNRFSPSKNNSKKSSFISLNHKIHQEDEQLSIKNVSPLCQGSQENIFVGISQKTFCNPFGDEQSTQQCTKYEKYLSTENLGNLDDINQQVKCVRQSENILNLQIQRKFGSENNRKITNTKSAAIFTNKDEKSVIHIKGSILKQKTNEDSQQILELMKRIEKEQAQNDQIKQQNIQLRLNKLSLQSNSMQILSIKVQIQDLKRKIAKLQDTKTNYQFKQSQNQYYNTRRYDQSAIKLNKQRKASLYSPNCLSQTPRKSDICSKSPLPKQSSQISSSIMFQRPSQIGKMSPVTKFQPHCLRQFSPISIRKEQHNINRYKCIENLEPYILPNRYY